MSKAIRPAAICKFLALLIATAGFTGNTWASANAHATLTDYTVTLIDLSPDDGIAPSLEVWRNGGYAFITLTISDALTGSTSQTDLTKVSVQSGSASDSSADAYARSTGQIIGAAYLATDASATLNSYAAGSPSSRPTITSGEIELRNHPAPFRLSSMTRITLTGVAVVAASISNPTYQEVASAGINMFAGDDFDSVSAYVSTYAAMPGAFDMESDILSVSFSNLRDTSATFNFGVVLATLARTNAPASPVPEPDSSALAVVAISAALLARKHIR